MRTAARFAMALGLLATCFALMVAAAPVKVTTQSLPDGTVGTAYAQTLAATDGTPPYTWSVTDGSLPGGLNPSAGGSITGTPTAAGSFRFTVQVADSGGGRDTEGLRITIQSAPPLSITTQSLPDGTVGAAYSQTLAASGGSPPYVWSITDGALPGGLNLSGGGAITGTPAAAGSFNFTVQVADSGSGRATRGFRITIAAAAEFSITIAPALSITTASPLPGATAGRPYSQALAASGGTSPFTWAITVGALPAGVSLDPASGAIQGTPREAGAFTFTVQVTDADPSPRSAGSRTRSRCCSAASSPWSSRS